VSEMLNSSYWTVDNILSASMFNPWVAQQLVKQYIRGKVLLSTD
jgi:hypothetical protein